MTYTTAFTAVANGGTIRLQPGQRVHISATVAAGKSFVGTVQLQRALTPDGNFSLVQVVGDGSGVALDENTAIAVDYTNDSRDVEYVRLANVLISTDAITFIIGTVGANISSPELREYHARMVQWLGTLPTADPKVLGEPYLSSGAVKVSAG